MGKDHAQDIQRAIIYCDLCWASKKRENRISDLYNTSLPLARIKFRNSEKLEDSLVKKKYMGRMILYEDITYLFFNQVFFFFFFLHVLV